MPLGTIESTESVRSTTHMCFVVMRPMKSLNNARCSPRIIYICMICIYMYVHTYLVMQENKKRSHRKMCERTKESDK